MIDFSNTTIRKKTYSGANGSKIAVLYDDEQYMLKFPVPPKRNDNMSYTNGCVSEYIGSHIFNSIGIKTQETLLGIYKKDDKEKIVVACKDFTSPGIVLQDFASLKNTIIDSVHNGYGTELKDVIYSMENQKFVDPVELKEWFWNIFIVDALIGNWDRHNGNWGFLYNTIEDTMEIAPVYDCGSCLFPQADRKIMQQTICERKELDLRVFTIPLSAITVNNKKINYFDFISSLENEECNAALKRIFPRIDMIKIEKIIDETPVLDDLQKTFYKMILKERKERILEYSLVKLIQKEKIHSS